MKNAGDDIKKVFKIDDKKRKNITKKIIQTIYLNDMLYKTVKN